VATIIDTVRRDVVEAKQLMTDAFEAFEPEYLGDLDWDIVSKNISALSEKLDTVALRCQQVDKAIQPPDA